MRLDGVERIARGLNDSEVRFIVGGRTGGSCPTATAARLGGISRN